MLFRSTCTHTYVCACGHVRVRACACEGIEGALPLGVLPPQERASLPSCLSTLGALRGGSGGFLGLSFPMVLPMGNGTIICMSHQPPSTPFYSSELCMYVARTLMPNICERWCSR